MKLLYDKWNLNKPIPNCLSNDVLKFLIENLNENINLHNISYDLFNKFGNYHNMWFSGIFLKEDIEKINNIKTDDWIYPIEPWGHLMYSLNFERKGKVCNFFELIPEYIKDSVNNGIGKIVVNYSHEGWVDDITLKSFYIGIKNVGLNFENIILILNDYNLEKKLETFKEKYNIEKYPKVINYSSYLTHSAKHFYYKPKFKNVLEEHTKYNRDYKFLYLNRRLDIHRIKLAVNILANLSSESIISFDKNMITKESKEVFEEDIDLLNKFNILPDKIIADREDIENTNGYQHENENMYLNAYVNIITETSFYNNNDFISEKIWKSIYYMQPFIVVGRPNLLKWLRKIGFKTFEFLIEEKYDSIENNDDRMHLITNEIHKLNSLSKEEIKSIIKNNFKILNHNFHLLNYFGKKSKDIENSLIQTIKQNNFTYIDIYKEYKINLI